MITYGYSLQGKSHIERNTVCQDSNIVVRLKSGYYLGVVADGVGSAPHSDVGSKMAVEKLYEYCEEHVQRKMQDLDLEDVLRAGYEYAFQQIEEYVLQKEDSVADYDTTLSSVLYDGKQVVYGHAGDGGIIVRKTDGTIVPITERQKGADGSSVRPLRAGSSSWDFGICPEQAASVLLLTDGMLDGVIQPVLVNLPSSAMELARGTFSKNHVYVTACEFFMNPDMVYANPHVKKPDAYMQHVLEGELVKNDQEDFLKCMLWGYTKAFGKEKAKQLCDAIQKFYFAVWSITKVTDDKSVVCLINEKAKVTPKEQNYYQEPNWKWRQESYQAILYGKPMPPEPKDDKILPTPPASKGKIPLTPPEAKGKIQPTSPERRKKPKKSHKAGLIVITISAMMICLAVGMIAGVKMGESSIDGKSGRQENEAVSQAAMSATSTPSSEEEEKNDNNLEKQASDFLETFDDMKITEYSTEDDSFESLKDKMEDMDVFDNIVQYDDTKDSTRNKQSLATPTETPTATPTATPTETPKNNKSSVKTALEILSNLDGNEKEQFQKELLWIYIKDPSKYENFQEFLIQIYNGKDEKR